MHYFKEQIKQLDDKIDNLRENFAKKQNKLLQRIEETINTQEEIIMDMIKKFNNEFYQHKTNILSDFEHLKNQQDVLKISYTINEKKLLNKIEKIVTQKLHDKINGRENEILMKLWIEEFKNIIENFDKLKKMKPDEFKIRLKEI
ncbi:MAG: hypothetical protein EU517_01300, partial [Promethearchaeota archaeon]